MKHSQLKQLIKEEISKELDKNKKLNEAMKFAEDLAPIIASGLVEKGLLNKLVMLRQFYLIY
tara:strand:- start:115 stop:300 length:186 start_codon:yes stop_codon:yes gene_type:complete